MKKGKWLIYFVLILAVAVMTIPFLWMLLTSFKTFEDSTKIPLQILPEQWILTNYTEILEVFPIAKWFMNSILAVVISLLAQVILGSLAAYAFARLRFPGKKFLFMLMLSIMMIPEQIFIIPRYNTLAAVGLTNTRVALWIVRLFSVFAVFMMRQFFMGVPKELNEAAAIDGAGPIRTFISIMLPMAKSTLASLAIIVFTYSWNDYFTTFIMINDTEKLTLPVGILSIKQPFSTGDNVVFAAVVLAILPVLIVFLIGQKWIVKSMTHVGVKG